MISFLMMLSIKMNCVGVQAMESILLISFGLINIHFVERIFINKKQ
jgi:hypothetical protein